MGIECEPGANWLIQHYLYDCIYTPKDLVGFILGMASILLWIIAQLPQFIDNIKNQSVDALSVWFLAQWFLGDTLNLLGCLMSGEQLPTTTALAMYFVVTDVLMLTQYVYYGALQRRKQLLMLKAQQRQSMKRSFHHHQSHHGHSVIHYNGHHQQAYLQQRPGRATMPCFSQQSAGSSHVGPSPQSVGSTASLPPSLVMLPGAAPQGMQSTSAQSQAGASGMPQARPAELRPAASTPQRSAIATVATAAGAASLLSLAAVSAGHAWQGSRLGSGPQTQAWHPHTHVTHAQTHGSSGFVGSSLGFSSHHHTKLSWFEDVDDLLRVLGTLFGSMSTLLYLGSRVSQIYKNWSRRSAEGLSLMMFVFTMSANMCTGSSILLRAKGIPALQVQLPWLLGAFGTVGLDAFIYHQACKYSKMNASLQQGGAHTAIIVQGEAHATACNTAGVAAAAHGTTNPLLQPLVAADC